MQGTGPFMELDICQMADQSQVNRIAGSLVARVRIEPVSVLGGTISFSAPQFIRATCPNLTVEFAVGFTFSGFVTVSGTARISARASARTTLNGGRRTILCLSNIQLLGLSIPAAPAFESLAAGAVSGLLPPELCLDITGAGAGL